MDQQYSFKLCVQLGAVGFNYEKFLCLTAFSYLHFNSETCVELLVVSADDFKKKFDKEFSYLLQCFPNCVMVREFDFNVKLHWPHSTRFLMSPIFYAEYTLITDVDIICLQEDVFEFYKEKQAPNFPYINLVREQNAESVNEPKRLTGVHCVKTKEYYIQEMLDEISFFKSKDTRATKDEMLLFKMCEKVHGILPKEFQTRLIPGIHCSLNRKPRTECADKTKPRWSAWFELHVKNFDKMTKEDKFKTFFNVLNEDMIAMLHKMRTECEYWRGVRKLDNNSEKMQQIV